MHWIYLLLLLTPALAHQTSLTAGGSPLFWPNPNVPIMIQTNTNDLSAGTINTVVEAAMNQWNLTGAVNVTASTSSVNEVRFTNDFAIYGSAVIGITEISYNATGAINKAVILLNDNFTFTNNSASFGGTSIYLGDVIAHELGHFFGLSHSEVLDSTMFYTSFPGQSTISSDDKSGIKGKYNAGGGEIYGYVQGGNHIGVLGVHVQAISRKTGEAIGTFTNDNGYFILRGLDLDDTYYIYTSPLKNPESLPGYFSNVQTEFCPGSYVGSFYSPCGKAADGFPQGINVTAAEPSVSAGVISISCSLRANEDYNYEKLQTAFTPVTVWAAEEGSITDRAFVGHFSKPADANWSKWDILHFDLSGVPLELGKYIKFNFVAYPFGNELEYEMQLYQNGLLVGQSAISYSNALGTYNSNMVLSITLNTANQLLNNFDIKVRSRRMTNTMLPLTFPSPNEFTTDSHMPYLLTASLMSGLSNLINTSAILSDNDNCLDAPYTYKVSQTKALAENAVGTEESSPGAAAACGTIEPPKSGGPGGALPLIALGFALSFLLGIAGKKSKNFLS